MDRYSHFHIPARLIRSPSHAKRCAARGLVSTALQPPCTLRWFIRAINSAARVLPSHGRSHWLNPVSPIRFPVPIPAPVVHAHRHPERCLCHDVERLRMRLSVVAGAASCTIASCLPQVRQFFVWRSSPCRLAAQDIAAQGSTPRFGGTLVLANRDDPPSGFDSMRTSSIALHEVGGALFGPGQSRHAGTARPVPAGAVSGDELVSPTPVSPSGPSRSGAACTGMTGSPSRRTT